MLSISPRKVAAIPVCLCCSRVRPFAGPCAFVRRLRDGRRRTTGRKSTMNIGNRIGAAWLAMVACLLAGAAPAQTGSVVVYSAVSPKVMTAFVEEFQKQNPGVKVDL